MPIETSHPTGGGPRFRATDSPWFWMLVFSLTAAAGLAAIAPKFAGRQARLEGRWAGREQAAVERARRAAGLEPTDLAEEAREPDAEPRRVVALWPLAVLAGLVAAGSAAMLAREARRAGVSR
ncbi:MAG: hypothetical protein ACKOZU_02445 [Planctomycetaceae bacterium]